MEASTWHALLAPLPEGAVPRRQPVASPEVLATAAGAAIAGWEQLTLELSAGPAGLRVVMVVLDQTGQPISASDSVLRVVERGPGGEAAGAVVEYRHESVGGRLEPDGSFRGTRWRALSVQTEAGDELEATSTPAQPSAADVAGIKALVAELLRRAPPRHEP